MLLLSFPRDVFQTDASDSRWCPGEVFIDQLLAEADRFEDLGATVGFDRGNTHFRHHFYYAFENGFDVSFHRLVVGAVLEHPFTDHVVQTLVGQVGIDGLDAVADQQAEVVHLPRLSGLEYQAYAGAGARPDEMMMKA